MKWVEISNRVQTEQVESIHQFLQEQGVENSYEVLTPTVSDFGDALKRAMATVDSIRIGSPFRQETLNYFTSLGANLTLMGAADCIIKDGTKWWPQAAFSNGMKDVLNRQNFGLDMDTHALIVGTGAYGRFSAAVAINIGFRNILVTNKFDEQGLEFVKDMRRSHFGVNFQFVPQADLVMLPGNTGLLINSTPLVPENDLLNELYFFNFLKSSGVVIDLIAVPPETPLVTGARNLGAKFIRGVDVLAQADIVWMEWATGKKLEGEKYTKMLTDRLALIPFDLKPYQAILDQNQMQKQTSV